ncbi:MAG: NTP transferase domain-containing protein [Betaproteobacteria bacterium]|nr:NTP transferase domain-containing protein [Betaproteobacteria bacterium]
MLPRSAVVLAGGLGTRLREAVPDLPKPMAPVGDRPFLEHLLDYWIGQGISRFVLSVGYRHAAITEHFGGHYAGAAIDYAIEGEPLGTGGGVVLASRHLDEREPFLVLNGDTYFRVDLATLARFFLDHDADWCFSLFRTREQQRYMGLTLDADGRILSLRAPIGPDGGLANGGVYLMRPGALDAFRSFEGKLSLEDDIFARAFTSGQNLFGIEFAAPFLDIGIPSDFRRAAEVVAS